MIKKLKSVAAAVLRRIHVAGWFGVGFLFVAGILPGMLRSDHHRCRVWGVLRRVAVGVGSFRRPMPLMSGLGRLPGMVSGAARHAGAASGL